MKFVIAFAIALLLSAAGNAQPLSAQTYLPQGSWQDSCRDAHVRGSILAAQCRADDDSWVRSTLDTSQCSNGQVSNQNGSLTCERGSQYYHARGNNRGNARSAYQMPNGSWSNSCSSGQMRGSVLLASCRNDRGDYQQTSLDVQQCRYSNVSNRNGALV